MDGRKIEIQPLSFKIFFMACVTFAIGANTLAAPPTYGSNQWAIMTAAEAKFGKQARNVSRQKWFKEAETRLILLMESDVNSKQIGGTRSFSELDAAFDFFVDAQAIEVLAITLQSKNFDVRGLAAEKIETIMKKVPLARLEFPVSRLVAYLAKTDSGIIQVDGVMVEGGELNAVQHNTRKGAQKALGVAMKRLGVSEPRD